MLHLDCPVPREVELDTWLARFEARWKEGQRPLLADFLPAWAGPRRQELVVALVRLELELRLKAGDAAPLVQGYFREPALALGLAEQAVLIAEEYQARWERGDSGLDRDEYAKRFPGPDHAEVIARLQPHWDCPRCRRGKGLAVEDVRATTLTCPKCGQASEVKDLPCRRAFARGKDRMAPIDLLPFLRPENRVGEGGMGEVYLIPDLSLGRDLALKVVHSRYQDNREAEQRLVVEAQIAARLDHPGVVPIHERGRLPDGRAYYTMRLIRGETLKTLLARRDEATERPLDFLDVFLQVCRTVQHAHERRVIHRDLKPENIMVGAAGEIQVLDWGLAQGLDAPRVARRARNGAVEGTPLYMAPEQARGEGDRISERADVFALGAILCEILTGASPYLKSEGERPANEEVLRRVREANLAPALERLSKCREDAELAGLAKDCLTPEPAPPRPANAGEVAQRVAAYRKNQADRLRGPRPGRA
jgi:hypothetical protein